MLYYIIGAAGLRASSSSSSCASGSSPSSRAAKDTGDFRAKILNFGGFDSSRILSVRGGLPRPVGNFPESLSPAILGGIILVGRLGVGPGIPKLGRRQKADTAAQPGSLRPCAPPAPGALPRCITLRAGARASSLYIPPPPSRELAWGGGAELYKIVKYNIMCYNMI